MPMMKSILRSVVLLILMVSPASAADQLSPELRQLMAILTGEAERFSLRVEVWRGGASPEAVFSIARRGDEDFSLWVTADKYKVGLERTKGETELILPHQQVYFRGIGEVAEAESIRLKGIALRILSRDSSLRPWYATIGLLRNSSAACRACWGIRSRRRGGGDEYCFSCLASIFERYTPRNGPVPRCALRTRSSVLSPTFSAL